MEAVTSTTNRKLVAPGSSPFIGEAALTRKIEPITSANSGRPKTNERRPASSYAAVPHTSINPNTEAMTSGAASSDSNVIVAKVDTAAAVLGKRLTNDTGAAIAIDVR